MSITTTFVGFIGLLMTVCNALPTDVQLTVKENETTYNPFSPGFRWTNYNMAAYAAGVVVVGAGLAVLTAFFFPIFGYKICYALGGCQNTLDNYVDHFIGIQGHTKKITKRDIQKMGESRNMDYFMDFLKMAMTEYEDKPSTSTRKENSQNNVMRLTPGSEHQIEKRSPLDYIEPVLVMLSKAYNEFIDPELKKNFRKRRSIS